jgi:hypothetical protein
MKYKVGDKVKFLNEIGGGIIRKIINPTLVCVAVEDGFDVPVRINEIIMAESDNPRQTMFNQDFSIPSAVTIESEKENDVIDRTSKLQKFSSLTHKPKGIYLGYVPQDQVWLLKENIDFYLINYTSFEIVYNLIVKRENTYIGVDYGSIEPFSKIHIQTILRTELEQWVNGFVQALFFKDEDTTVHMPLHAPFKIPLLRFLQKDAYTTTNFMEEKGLFVSAGHPVSALQSQIEWEKDSEVLHAMQSQPAKLIETKKIIDKYKIDNHSAEVDLHIENLTSDHSQMNSREILELQRRLCIQCLESAIAEKLHRIIFIHGVGNGVLKHEISALLKEYPNLHSFDAPMQKYGCGATEVLIKSICE